MPQIILTHILLTILLIVIFLIYLVAYLLHRIKFDTLWPITVLTAMTIGLHIVELFGWIIITLVKIWTQY
jgi:hypothetical protein